MPTDYNNKLRLNREWADKRIKYRRAKLEKYMQKKGCTQCGYNENPLGLEWDHIEEIGNRRVSAMYHMKLSTLFKEIRKCQVLCGTCHSIKSKTFHRDWKKNV